MAGLGRRDVEKNHFTPRDYQIELFDIACKRNTIVQLGTGSGKTFIGVLLIKEFAIQVYPKFEDGGRRIFFIVDRVSLVEQQAEVIERHTTLKVGKMHGNLNQDVWQNKENCDKYFAETHVVVLTAQIFLDLLSHAYFDINRAALLVFDECHHALGSKHAYRLIMDKYRKMPEVNGRPRVLALTASLINDKSPPNKLEEQIDKLERVLSSTIATASDLVTLSKFGAKPSEMVVVARKYDYAQGDSGNLIRMLDNVRNFCKNTQEFHPDMDIDPRKYINEAVNRTIAVLKQCGPWCGLKVAQLFEKEQNKHGKQTHIGEKTVDFFRMGETAMFTVKRVLEPKMRPQRTLESFKEFLPNKVSRLFDILACYNPDKLGSKTDQLQGIIFVDQRMVAYALKLLIKTVARYEPQFSFIKADFVVGFSGATYSDSAESTSLHKRQEEVLRKFRRGDLNLLVATNVLEEGIDVEKCNFVLKFDRPADYRAYVQSKGRARKPGAKYFILIDEDDVQQCQEDLRDFNEIERMLLKRYKCVNNPSEQASEELSNVDDVAPPYVVPETGAEVTLSGAIALVNRYCSMLPSDIFTRLVPDNRIIPVQIGGTLQYKAELFLPINSPLKKSILLTTPMESKKLAQMTVALEACRQLHQKGELNEYLLPQGKDTVARMLTQLDDDPDEYMPGVQAKVGSAKRKQLYDKRIARALNDALPHIGQTTYIYVLEMELIKEPSPELNPKGRKFANPQATECCFGFLSGKKIPKIPPFPAYLRQGDMRIHVRRARSTVTLNDHELQLLMQFHHYLFRNVLVLNKVNLDFSLSPDTPVNTVIVPLNRVACADGIMDYKINMKYVIEVVQCMGELPRVPTEDERKDYKFRREDYTDSVVMPWYRNMETPSFYYVAEILEEMNPSSQFPDSNFETFNEYFVKKYELKIYDQEQCLLDVDFTSNRMNLLLPRSRGGKKVVRPVDSTQRQILVPELMDRHPIAAHLWNTICALPCFFYRINQLLLADELRERICRDALGIVDTSPPEEFQWAALSYPATYEEKQSLIVSKIQQLRDENKKNMGSSAASSSDCSMMNGGKRMNADGTMSGFEIGVWDPDLATGLEWSPNDLVPGLPGGIVNAGGSVPDTEMEDATGLVKSSSVMGDLSDDEEGDAVVLMDFAKHVCSQTNDPKSFAAPRAELIDTLGCTNGWEDDSGWGQLDTPSQDAPFQLISTSGGLDLNGLVLDLQKHVLDVPLVNPLVDLSASTSSSQLHTKPTSGGVHQNTNSGIGTTVSSTSVSTPSPPIPQAVAKSKPIDLLTGDPSPWEGSEMQEDHDRPSHKQEEVIDLIDFDDGVSDDIPPQTAREYDSDDEFQSLEEGERVKSTRDTEIVERTVGNLPVVGQRAVLAPEVQLPFSFSSSSPSVSGYSLVSGAARTDDLISFEEQMDVQSSTSSTSTLSQPPPAPLPSPLSAFLAGTPFPMASEDSARFGVSPCVLLQAMTTSNANDGINLERLETIGDSFLKYAVTDYLYHMHPDQHEGKLSFARSKEVSNCNLYRLGKRAGIPALIIGTKFDVQDSWLPPCYVPNTNFKAPNAEDADLADRIMERVLENGEVEEEKTVKATTGWDEADAAASICKVADGVEVILFPKTTAGTDALEELHPLPYNMLTQQMISDKSIADAVEALIGAHLLSLGPQKTLKVMDWLGLKVLTEPVRVDPPLLRYIDTMEEPDRSERQLREYWVQFQLGQLEEKIGYRFQDKAYLMQAFTHASFFRNRITGCYQRLEFLGDAVLDYMITRFLFEHEKQYSPGVLTDLRSALVNNTIFASLAVKYDFHKHFVAMCPGLHHMIEKFVKLCEEKNFFEANFNAEMYMVTTEEEYEEGQEEDIEVPKAMGDIFESVAGAIYLDSGGDLDTVWRVFYALMKQTIEECCRNPPRSPIRELLELEPERTRFSRMERIMASGKVRVTVDVGKQPFRFTGMGRSYRIAKATAAKRALKYLKSLEEQKLRDATKKAAESAPK